MALSPKLAKRLKKFTQEIRQKTESYMGYPVSKDFEYEALLPLLQYPLNNLGDPFIDSTWKVDSREFEREVIEFFAELLRAPKNNWWGYVTNGGTEGNLYGLYLARELYPKGICYFSQDTHYSVSKNLHLLNMRHIMIRSQDNGEIDYEDLRETIRLHRDLPAIIFANSGTTMTEAKDDISKIRLILDEFSIANRYIHSDAALCGAINPFLEPRPHYDFADGADSISISGHKFIGSPIPCGIVLARKEKVDRIARSIAYIGCLDTTITGSRNGFTPLVMWYAINKWGKEGLALRAKHSVETAEYTEQQLKSIGIEAWRNHNSITVVFPEISDDLKEKYQLATANGITHLICMPNIQKHHIDAFVADLEKEQKEKDV
ncbi:histidine decarboxylase [Aliikangiella sp. G2MR2-5]|uniref:histidine decarboxylase n=1 Tax=Aliikangiella sp. G2MR2-5 TaxID=2788943 RepID=UPI0018A8EEF4|nr:histidine decarboxylase [Aliikangiella sp. G2MR2-5]